MSPQMMNSYCCLMHRDLARLHLVKYTQLSWPNFCSHSDIFRSIFIILYHSIIHHNTVPWIFPLFHTFHSRLVGDPLYLCHVGQHPKHGSQAWLSSRVPLVRSLSPPKTPVISTCYELRFSADRKEELPWKGHMCTVQWRMNQLCQMGIGMG